MGKRLRMNEEKVKQLVSDLKEQTINFYGDSILPYQSRATFANLVKEVESPTQTVEQFSFRRVLTDKKYFTRTVKKIIHYGAVGLIGVVVNLIVFNVLFHLVHIDGSIANLLAIAVSMSGNVVIALRTRLVTV